MSNSKGVGENQMGSIAHTWIFPISPKFNNPPSLSLGKSCPFHYGCIDIAGWGSFLIKMHVYMMPELLCVGQHNIPLTMILIAET